MHVADAVLFDIPFHKEVAPQQYTHSKNLRIADLNNVQALKMTHFSQSQLHCLYAHFGLAALVVRVGTTIPIFTSHTYYRIHREEVASQCWRSSSVATAALLLRHVAKAWMVEG